MSNRPEDRYLIGDNGLCYVSVEAMKDYATQAYANALLYGILDVAMSMRMLLNTLTVAEDMYRARSVVQE